MSKHISFLLTESYLKYKEVQACLSIWLFFTQSWLCHLVAVAMFGLETWVSADKVEVFLKLDRYDVL